MVTIASIQPAQRHAYQQTPREVRRRIFSFDRFLAAGETIDDVSVTVTPPTSPITPGYVAPSFDHRIAFLDTSAWDVDGVNTQFPLVSVEGASLQPLAAWYLMLMVDGEHQQPLIDYVVSGAQVIFTLPPGPTTDVWGHVQNPVLPTNEARDLLTEPPYAAFDVEPFVVAPDDRKVLLVSQGGSHPLNYEVKLRVETSLGQQREIAVDYMIREP